MDGNEVIEGLQDRIRGRWSAYDIIHPETGEIIVPADTMITVDQAEAVEKAGIKKVWIRTVLTCRSEVGICAKCYGANMASGRYVRIGESVGIIAAQSIGEPGTQLTNAYVPYRRVSQVTISHRVFPVSRNCLKQESLRVWLSLRIRRTRDTERYKEKA